MTENQLDLFSNPLPGVSSKSTLSKIYLGFLSGKRMTSLSALYEYQTICLPKYVSLLRLDYKIDIHDEWLGLKNGKKVKRYFIEKSK